MTQEDLMLDVPSRTLKRLIPVWACLGAALVANLATAADLPPHLPLRILIVSDEVNPHALSDADLTQPGDLSTALLAADSGLNIDPSPDGVLEIATDDLGLATTALSVPNGDPAAFDVVVYFAHRIPGGPTGQAIQNAFDAAIESFLINGGGLVAFHHGMYFTAGKQGIQDIIGVTADGSVPWNVVEGQNVIDVAPGHFVTTNSIETSQSVSYADPARGVSAGSYDFFSNIPDERYISLEINPGAETLIPLFASNYSQNGTTHLLGFTHQRAHWDGIVVGYQPGEYQPSALDDRAGNNFQILANAILYASGFAVGTGVRSSAPSVDLTSAPNPFRGRTQIGFSLNRPSSAVLTVYDLAGRRIRSWRWGTLSGGNHSTPWDGRDEKGRRVAAGSYVYELLANGRVQTGRVVRIR